MNNPQDPLVDLAEYGFVLEPEYFNQHLTTEPRIFLRQSVAEKLAALQERLSGYRFKIWDGYRPLSVQKALFERFCTELREKHADWDTEQIREEAALYVALPDDSDHVPPHNTGGTVDLTLVDEAGKELEMGTGFDHFGREAAPFHFEKTNPLFHNNRLLLREAMMSEDFSPNEHEWWHFDYGNWKWAEKLGRPQALFGSAE